MPPAAPPAYLPEPPDYRAQDYRRDLPPPPNFRGTLAEDDLGDINYQQQAHQPQPPAIAYHDPYANTPYGYEEDLPPHLTAVPPIRPTAAPDPRRPILSHQSEAQAAAAFRELSESLLTRAVGGRPLEELTTDLLRGMLKQWLDDNLPSLVERLVREEISRVARRGR